MSNSISISQHHSHHKNKNSTTMTVLDPNYSTRRHRGVAILAASLASILQPAHVGAYSFAPSRQRNDAFQRRVRPLDGTDLPHRGRASSSSTITMKRPKPPAPQLQIPSAEAELPANLKQLVVARRPTVGSSPRRRRRCRRLRIPRVSSRRGDRTRPCSVRRVNRATPDGTTIRRTSACSAGPSGGGSSNRRTCTSAR